MKKSVKTIASLALAGCLGASTFTACNPYENREDTLYVAAINKGYGITWLEPMLQRFCELNPGMKYSIKPFAADGEIGKHVNNGLSYCNFDVIFTGDFVPAEAANLADLTDIYEYTYESGSRKGKTVEELMESEIKKSMTGRTDGTAYKVMPWTASMGSFCLNYTKLNELFGAGWEETYKLRTTEELVAFCEAIYQTNAGKDKKDWIYAFSHASDNNTNGGLFETWFAQYNGLQGVADYNQAKIVDEYTGEVSYGAAVGNNEGTLKALEVGKDIWGNANYWHPKSNNMAWEDADINFMTGASVLSSQGDWVTTEAGVQFPNVDIRYKRVPVVSALGEKLGITEDELCEFIDYVDAVNDGQTPTKPSVSTDDYTTDELIEIISEARSIVNSSAGYFTCAIPSYSIKMDTAKSFLKFMVSDEGQEIYMKNAKGLTMCYGWNAEESDAYANLSTFAKSRLEIMKNYTLKVDDMISKYPKLGLAPFRSSLKEPLCVSLTSAKTAEDIYAEDYAYFQKNWATWESR